MRNDSIETLLLRHYGSSAPAPVNLEQRLSKSVRQEAAAVQASQKVVTNWQQRRVSRRRMLQLVTFSGAGLGALAMGLDALQKRQKPAYAY
jgi:mannitol-specific phosphotransferase system IIBC component